MYKPAEGPRQLGQTARHSMGRAELRSVGGAFDEQLAGRLLHPSVERSGDTKMLTNLKLVAREKAHAARRLTQRTI